MHAVFYLVTLECVRVRSRLCARVFVTFETVPANSLVLWCYNEFRKDPPNDEIDVQDQEMYIRRVRRQRTKKMASEEEARVWRLGRKARKEKRR